VPDQEYGCVQLHGIEGYTVFFADGQRLGQVAWIEYASRSDQPDMLIVRRRFYERPRLVRVATEMIESVERLEQTIHLDVPYNRNHFFLRQRVER
jgi:ribosomal 30S subunit maturation factor RimM